MRRIHEVLDGHRSRDELGPGELTELAAVERAIEEALVEGPAPEPAPDVTGAVMWRIARLEREAVPAATPAPWALVRRSLRWLLAPQPLSLRPASALAAVVGVLMLGGLAASTIPGGGTARVAVEPSAQPLLVQFRVGIQGAQRVALVGDFSGWREQVPLEEVAPGVWSTTIELAPGIYDYGFVVNDERFTLDPLAPMVSDGFGGANSRIAVLAAGQAGEL